jgi:UDP-N-acetylglucosamine--N-acetylmuramyl-(pentapeptide) pyrophosphoryl-undecaprenol N-acetylglucosamine transferase
VPYHLLPFHPFYRRQWWKNLRWPVLLPSLLRRVDALLDAEHPDAVIGTGGYVSGPVLWRAAKRNIPTGILELDVRPGIATRLLAGRVREIWLAAPETLAVLRDRGRSTVTGAPISPPDPARRTAALHRFSIAPDRPVLVVTGGSQGSLAINRIVSEWVRGRGGAPMQVIWATGRATYNEFASLHDPPNVHVLPFIEPMADAWSVADLCVARAGMMTLAELCAWGIPSVLIPLPSAASDHQTHNARAMAAAGAAVVIPQAGLDAAALGAALHDALGNGARLASMAAAARARGNPGAAAFIAQRIAALADGGSCVAANS